ncbi:Acetophenone carboxylase gamma subunit [Castellaniella defragrans]
MSPTVLSIDVGGTFTDFVIYAGGRIDYVKTPTSKPDQSVAILQTLTRSPEFASLDLKGVSRLVHGTTVATNTILERSGAHLGLIATKGFRDAIVIGRQMRHRMYDAVLYPETPTFLFRDDDRFEVDERIDKDGKVLKALDDDEVLSALDSLVQQGVDCVVVALLYSFANPVHERRIAALIESRYPDLSYSLSSAVDPNYREYERTLVTSFDAYVKPSVDIYIEHLESQIGSLLPDTNLQLMQSSGGLTTFADAKSTPVNLLLSGPAAGVIGAQAIGSLEKRDDLLTVDVGGTSSDVSLIYKNKPLIRSEGALDSYPLRVPMVDVTSIGSGGGSIAWIDEAGGLKVGPRSAGAEPGPACYGNGGTDPTVTDASVVLGYIDPDYFAGGNFRLDAERALSAITEKIAKPLNISPIRAALGIHAIVNSQMAEATRLVSIARGHDPRSFTLMPLGGGGAIHVCHIARQLGISDILVPRAPGVLSAIGLLAAPIRQACSAACNFNLDKLADSSSLLNLCTELEHQCRDKTLRMQASPEECLTSYVLEMCYAGQGYTVPVTLTDPAGIGAFDLLKTRFRSAHEQLYGYASDVSDALIKLVRVVKEIPQKPHFELHAPTSQLANAAPSTRVIYTDLHPDGVQARIYKRSILGENDRLDGPCIIEQDDTTILIPTSWRATITRHDNLIAEYKAQ